MLKVPTGEAVEIRALLADIRAREAALLDKVKAISASEKPELYWRLILSDAQDRAALIRIAGTLVP